MTGPVMTREHVEAVREAIADYGQFPHPLDEPKLDRLTEIAAHLEAVLKEQGDA